MTLITVSILSTQGQNLPVKAAREISFTTDEGSYMDLDISPDGRTLAFDMLGEIFTIQVSGGTATQLTRGLALKRLPVWSPDGLHIAYISDATGDYQLTVMDVQNRFQTTIGKIRADRIIWSPDSHYVGDGDIFYGVAGGRMTGNSKIKSPLRFSADGKVAYGVDSNKVYRYDLLTHHKEWLSQKEVNRNGQLSPDGHWWCEVVDSAESHRLVITDLFSNLERAVVSKLIMSDPRYTPGVAFQHFCFSPDAKSLYVSYGGKIHRINVNSGNDQIVPFVAKVKIDLGAFDYNTYHVIQGPVNVKYARSAVASPDGKQLVFEALNQIYIMDLPKGRPKLLTQQPVSQYQPCWSPDGKWISYVSWCDTSGGFLWKVSSTGRNPIKVTKLSGQYQRPCWSPDGKMIAVVHGKPILGDRDDPGLGRLELVPVSGGTSRILDDSIPLWNNLTFSKDGSTIFYKPSDRKKEKLQCEIISKNINNDKEEVIIFKPFDHVDGLQNSLSPDGRYLVYSQDEDLYIMPLTELVQPSVLDTAMHQSQLIRFAAGIDPGWERGGKMLAWTYGNHFYRIDPDKIMKAAEHTLQEEQNKSITEHEFITVDVQPDQSIPLNISVPGFYGNGTVALKNVRIITMHGDQVIEKGTIIIKDGRFVAVGIDSKTPVPSNAKVYDLDGKTIMPGLIDIHLHTRVPPDIFPKQSWMFLANLAYGTTTARDPSSNLDAFGYEELLRSGQMLGPRWFTVGRAVRLDDNATRFSSAEDALSIVQKRALFGCTEIKQYSLPSRIQRQWLLIACKQLGLNMTNEGDGNPIEQIGMIKDGSTGVEHNPIFGDVYDDMIKFYAKSGIYFTPTLQVAYGTEEGKRYFTAKYWHVADQKLQRFEKSDTSQKVGTSSFNSAETLQSIVMSQSQDTIHPGFLAPAHIDVRILKAGGRICLGSHGDDEGIGPHNEIWALVMGGFTNLQALQSATIRGAEALGVQRNLGSIEAGKIADLVILNSNPIDDIHNTRDIKYVMKDGVLYDGDTLDEVWPVYKKCPDWKLHVSNADQKNIQ